MKAMSTIQNKIKKGQSGSLKAFIAEITAFFIGNDREDKCFFLSGCMGTVIRHN